MNAFEKGSLTREDFESGKIVSLWDMLLLDAYDFIIVSTQLAGTCGMLKEIKIHYGSAMGNPKEFVEGLGLSALSDGLENLGLKFTKMSADRLRNLLQSNQSISLNQFQTDLAEIIQRFCDELKGQYFLIIPNPRLAYHNAPGTFLGKGIIDKTEDLMEDAAEAGDCFAFGKYTACVFHLMRIMERLVQQFGSVVDDKIDIKNETWDTILKKVKAFTDPNKSNDGKKQTEEQKAKNKEKRKVYQRFYDRLDAVRDVWRNDTMHPKATYTQDEADNILRAVREFVKIFTPTINKIKEEGEDRHT